MAVVRFLLQAVLYVPLMAVVGYFSTRPPIVVLPADQALLRLSLAHAGARRTECRERSAAELARLAPNMRTGQECPRERAAVTLEIELDGRPLYHVTVPPSGLRSDGPSVAYRRLAVPAGRHRIAARLSDRADGRVDWRYDDTIDFKAGAAIVIDFNAARGGFLVRS